MPKLLALPMGVKGVAVVASTFTHVALAWASLAAGHGGTFVSPVSLATPRTDEVEIEAPVEPEPAPPTTEPDDDDHHPHTPAHLAAVPHAHKHDYPVAPSHDTTPHDPHLVHLPFAPPSAPTGDPPSGEAAPAVVAAPTGAGRFTITVGTGGSGVAPGGGATSSVAPSGPPASTEIVPESTVSIPARVVASVRPAYPSAARAADIEADVALEMVVDATGAVLSARVVRPAGYGFDDAALQAIRRFRFSPAQRNGHAIGVRMRWVMQFRFQ